MEQLLLKLLTTPTNNILITILEMFPKREVKPTLKYKKGQYLYIEYNAKKPTLVAHLDTVTTNHETIAPTEKEVLWKKTATQRKEKTFDGWTGEQISSEVRTFQSSIISLAPDANPELGCLGGDDRAGVAVILEVIKNLTDAEMPNIMFTYGEERGCIGANQFVQDQPEHTNPFMLEFDRAGDDVVFYDTEAKEFQNLIVKAFDSEKGTGSTSDIRVFQKHFKINSANIGIGYKYQHSRNEIIDMHQMHKVVALAVKLLKDNAALEEISNVKWEEPVQSYTQYRGYGWQKYYGQHNDDFQLALDLDPAKPPMFSNEQRDAMESLLEVMSKYEAWYFLDTEKNTVEIYFNNSYLTITHKETEYYVHKKRGEPVEKLKPEDIVEFLTTKFEIPITAKTDRVHFFTGIRTLRSILTEVKIGTASDTKLEVLNNFFEKGVWNDQH